MVNLHSNRGRLLLAPIIIIILSLLASCASISTQTKFYEPIQRDLGNGEYALAANAIEQAYAKGKYPNKDRFLYYLDSGLAHHYADSFQVSIDRLAQAELLAEELFTRSISRAAASLLLNDNTLEYSGEDHEVIYTNLINALNYTELGHVEAAFVEVRRANLKMQNLEQKYFDAAETYRAGAKSDSSQVDLPYDIKPLRFSNSAFARYLSLHMYAAEGKLDDARIDYDLLKEAFDTQPQIYDFPAPEVKYTSEGKAILSVVALTGTSPVKNDLKLRIRTDKQLNLVQIMYDGTGPNSTEYGHFILPISEDYYFKFAIPVISSGSSRIHRIRVSADGVTLGYLQMIENVNRVAAEVFEPKKTLIYVRTVARALVKGLTAHKLKKNIDKKNDSDFGAWLLKAAVDVGTDVIENADLRCSRLLPSYIYVGDFEIEPGTYDLLIEFLDTNGNVVDALHQKQLTVGTSQLNMVRSVSLK